ncbi:hypothetical protein MTO96_013784 [Rhipicephalus appendiculatus]
MPSRNEGVLHVLMPRQRLGAPPDSAARPGSAAGGHRVTPTVCDLSLTPGSGREAQQVGVTRFRPVACALASRVTTTLGIRVEVPTSGATELVEVSGRNGLSRAAGRGRAGDTPHLTNRVTPEPEGGNSCAMVSYDDGNRFVQGFDVRNLDQGQRIRSRATSAIRDVRLIPCKLRQTLRPDVRAIEVSRARSRRSWRNRGWGGAGECELPNQTLLISLYLRGSRGPLALRKRVWSNFAPSAGPSKTHLPKPTEEPSSVSGRVAVYHRYSINTSVSSLCVGRASCAARNSAVSASLLRTTYSTRSHGSATAAADSRKESRGGDSEGPAGGSRPDGRWA